MLKSFSLQESAQHENNCEAVVVAEGLQPFQEEMMSCTNPFVGLNLDLRREAHPIFKSVFY